MKEKLYTIPINEAFEKNSECPFCSLFEELEKRALEYTLGPSYMEPDIRLITNKLGFCREHYTKMYNMNNRLGLSLMTTSHFDSIISIYENFYKENFLERKKGLFEKKKAATENPIKQLEKSCFICEKISADMDKFFDTFIFMWRKEKEFKNRVLSSNGFCLKHFDTIICLAHKKMPSGEFEEFFNLLLKKQTENLHRVKEDLDWFIQKFDCRFKNEPWKNSKDALKRSIIKIASVNPEKGEDN